jgi:hypothetical protein
VFDPFDTLPSFTLLLRCHSGAEPGFRFLALGSALKFPSLTIGKFSSCIKFRVLYASKNRH